MSGNLNERVLAVLERLEGGQAQLQEAVASVQTHLGTLEGRLDSLAVTLEDRLGSLENRLNSLESRLDSVESRLGSLESRLDGQNDTLTRFRADLVDEFGRTRNALMARMDRLQETLVIQREADVVNYGAAERAERIAKGASDEGRILGEQLNALVRQVRRLEDEVRHLRGPT